MEGQLIKITEKMAGSKELAEALNENFKILHDDAKKHREYVRIKLNDNSLTLKKMKADIFQLNTNVSKILKHFGIK